MSAFTTLTFAAVSFLSTTLLDALPKSQLAQPQPTADLVEGHDGAETTVEHAAAPLAYVISPWGWGATYRVCWGWNRLRCSGTGLWFSYYQY